MKGRKTTPKVVVHYSNTENPERCFVTLFKKYRQLCPDDPVANSFYLQPSRTPTDTCWYTRQPLGHSMLGGTVARLCKQTGIEGYETNHSLRATAITSLFESGVDKQQIMERTGHRSLEGVRSYKRMSDKHFLMLRRPPVNNQTDSAVHRHSNTSGLRLHKPTAAPFTQLVHRHVFNDCTVNFFIGAMSTTESRPKSRRPLVIDDSDSD